MHRPCVLFGLAAMFLSVNVASAADIPEDFPRFIVPGHEQPMENLRALYWHHYPGTPAEGATLWDSWLVAPTLWPAVDSRNLGESFRRRWNQTLRSRHLDSDGYVSTHQHGSISHTHGWPFPMWTAGQGEGWWKPGLTGWGWHFSYKNTVGPPWRSDTLNTPDGWTLEGAMDEGIGEWGWNLNLTRPNAAIVAPEREFETLQAPFLQLRWRAKGLGNARPYIEWTSREHPEFNDRRRIYFDPIESSDIVFTMIPMYRHPEWSGTIKRLRIGFGQSTTEAAVVLQAFFTHYDTRHNVNSQSYIRGCADYFWWTGDLTFLRKNMDRMRSALRHVQIEHHALMEKIVMTTWVGHDGRSGLGRAPDGGRKILPGRGIGNNYWDLVPFGWKDAYATILYYDALLTLAALEAEILAHPEWNIPPGVLRYEPAELRREAAAVKETGNRLFWNPETERFVACIDADGQAHDYGFTFVNCEAVYYDFATPDHAEKILAWICGERTVKDDTALTTDIYHWRFAPRATTRRNTEYYFWGWNGPETIPFGGQVQDGGAVLGFSYHDILARLKQRGPDNAWQRLREIAAWYGEVREAGGYRKYYDGNREGALQGGGTAGGLGMDREFAESILVPHVMMQGFLGFQPTGTGFAIHPRLPAAWKELTIDRISLHGQVIKVHASHDAVVISRNPVAAENPSPCAIRMNAGQWKARRIDGEGKSAGNDPAARRVSDDADEVLWDGLGIVRLERVERK